MKREINPEVARYLISVGVPDRTMDAARADMVHTDAIEAIAAARDLTVLSGRPGVGKSVAACLWLVANGSRDGYRMWIQAAELSRGFAYDPEQYWKAAKAHALVIDDVGVEYLDKSDRYLATFEELLSKRFACKRRTLLTTNLAPAEFKTKYGERIASRINEAGKFVVCVGQDLRRRVA